MSAGRPILTANSSEVSTLDGFPSLVPVKSPTPRIHAPTSIASDEDKYATLFSPPTPRASPTSNTPAISIPAHHKHPETPNSADSEFGSFVSVEPLQDPLSAFATAETDYFPAISDTTSAVIPSLGHKRDQSASLNFFDKFAQEAKVASERNRHGVLDELIMSDSDPTGWWKDQEAQPVASVHQPDATAHQPDATAPLLDLGFDEAFFTPKLEKAPSAEDTSRTRKSSSSSSSHSQSHSHPHSRPNPRRSPTISMPVVAPPLASTSSVSTPLTDQVDSAHPGSYQTLTNISSRWMTSLLRPSASSSSLPTLDSLYIDPNKSQDLSRSQSTSRSKTYTPPVVISHGTPFSSSMSVASSSASPFAAHVYVPPTGAPGFRGESYDWDKGYSGQLEAELNSESSNGHGKADGKQHDLPVAISGSRTTTPQPEIGRFMEKRSGSVELLGRRPGTNEVLDVDLADSLRPHLPALFRLHRKWTLLYSLDQHGISLNTLYSQCENLSKDLRGSAALVVMKDASDSVFGVWLGGGLHQSKSRGYYGSGESFLWTRHPGTDLDVFKWTGRNDYVALCESGYMSFGGGDGAYGLYLDDTLLDGSSAPCSTFGNPPLCSPATSKGKTVPFECVGLEVWAMGGA